MKDLCFPARAEAHMPDMTTPAAASGRGVAVGLHRSLSSLVIEYGAVSQTQQCSSLVRPLICLANGDGRTRGQL